MAAHQDIPWHHSVTQAVAAAFGAPLAMKPWRASLAALPITLLVLAGALPAHTQQQADHNPKGETMPQHPYVGTWVTSDGHVRHELLANGRYDEARGGRKSAYQGRYEVSGTKIDYWDDTGFTADGVFVSDDELHHGGMVLRRTR